MTNEGTQINDMVQSVWGSFFHNNGDGTFDCLDTVPPTKVGIDAIEDGRLLVRDGVATGYGDPTATRFALFMLRTQYAATPRKD